VSYARAINVPGWHLHFVTADRRGGGHVLACKGETLQAAIQELADVRIAMPETASFLQAELSQDPSRDLDVAEWARQGADSSR
jgi:acetolactate decarboxylase